ncbi:MAG: pseudouridine synthase [Maricaulaceae bacterium]
MSAAADPPAPETERIAKVLARAGVCSRRDAERLIAEGRVVVNGETLTSPAVKVGPDAAIGVNGKLVDGPQPTRLWRYHKPAGRVTTHKDPEDRPTVFQALPKSLPRVISVGRLDLNSEGLLLLTNDGELARALELPATGWTRRYRVRAYGRFTPNHIERLSRGLTVEGVRYGPIQAQLEREQGDNVWLDLRLKEGKNREVRRVLEALGLRVNRLIRTAYGPFQLGALSRGEVEEAPAKVVREQTGALAKKLHAHRRRPV